MSFINGNIPVTAAWNILCEAVAERQSFFGSHGRSYSYHRVPALPASRYGDGDIRSMIPSMREAVRDLTASAFDCHKFGQWSNLSSMTGVNALFYPDEPFFREYQVDPYAFLFQPSEVPSYRHAVSEFIAAAAKILNDAVRYPRPRFDTAWPLAGFGLDAELELQWGSDYQHRIAGSYAEVGNLSSSEAPSLANINWQTPAIWQNGVGRGRADNFRWIWRGGGTDGGIYIQPQLTGSCRLRSQARVQYIRGYTDNAPQIIELDMEEFTIDFNSNQADRRWDMTKIGSIQSEIWNSGDEEKKEFEKKSLRLEITSAEVLLTEANFPKLTYKYLE